MIGAGATIDTAGNRSLPSLGRCVLTGALGFCIVSLCVFATVAYGEIWMYKHLGLAGAYLVWILLFIVLGGRVLSLLVGEPSQRRQFYLVFGMAFLAYALGWIGAYFTMRSAAGEWLGSLAGSVLMACVLSFGLSVPRLSSRLSVVLFCANCAGYFVGSFLNETVGGRTGMMLWGTVYGLCLGAGLGAALHLCQRGMREMQV